MVVRRPPRRRTPLVQSALLAIAAVFILLINTGPTPSLAAASALQISESALALPPSMPLAAPCPPSCAVPVVTLNVPATVMLGQDVDFTITFDNNATAADGTGFGPFIDLYLPSTGADGDGDGLGNNSIVATYLGTSVTMFSQVFPASGVLNHPLSYAMTTGAPLQVNGTPGDTLVTIQLPFGSFTHDQPPAVVDVSVDMSNFANFNVPLTVRARGGFTFGNTALNDWCCADATIVNPVDTNPAPNWPSADVTPIVMTTEKEYVGPEDETATGPNFPRQYLITAEIAPGQTVDNLVLDDTLPNNIAVDAVNCSAGGVDTSPPGGAACTFATASGTATMTIDFHVDLFDNAAAYVIDPNTGDDATSFDQATSSASWTPLDPDDATTTVGDGPCPACPSHTLTPKSITIQKSTATDADGNAIPVVDLHQPGLTPDDIVEYSLDFQISDYFAFDNIEVVDALSDGQHIDTTFTPTLTVSEHGITVSSGAMGVFDFTAGTGDVQEYFTGGTPGIPALAPYANGDTVITFRVSDELVNDGSDSILQGGCVPVGGTGGGDPDCSAFNGGGLTGTITYRAVIQEEFTDIAGDVSVDHGDPLSNSTVITGDVLDVTDLVGSVDDESDDSGAAIEVIKGGLTKSIYSYSQDNGATFIPYPPGTPVSPGDQLVFRLTYTLPSSDTENLILTDYLPLPVLDADEITTFDATVSAAEPPAGTAKFGPSDTFFAQSAIVPSVIVDSNANSVGFDYGPQYDGPGLDLKTVDILFTVTISDEPFADELLLTNFARATEVNSFGTISNEDTLVQFTLGQPILQTTKTIIATNSTSATAAFTGSAPSGVVFPDPPYGSLSPRWTGGPVTDPADLGNQNATGLEGNDIVSFAILVYNVGHSSKGAFDITLRDILQHPDYQIPYPTYATDGDAETVNSINLQVTYGDGTAVSWVGLGDTQPAPPLLPGGILSALEDEDDLFGGGIEIVDPGPDQGACQLESLAPGKNVIVVTYDLRIRPGIAPNTVIVNTGHVMTYAGEEGGPDHLLVDLDDDLTDTARITIGSTAGKLANPNDLTIGETYVQTINVQIPSFTQMAQLPSNPGFVELRDHIESNGAHAIPGTETFSVTSDCSPGSLNDPAFLAGIVVTTAATDPTLDTALGEDVIWAFPAPIDNSTGATPCNFSVSIQVRIVDIDQNDGLNYWLPPLMQPIVTPYTADDTAEFTYTDSVTGNQTSFNSGSFTVNVHQPVIDMDKSIVLTLDASHVVKANQLAELRRLEYAVFNVVMTNVGDSDAFEVSFTDTLPVHVQFVNGSVFLDNGNGGGTAGNGIRDGLEVTLGNPTITGAPTTTGQTLSFAYNQDIPVGGTFGPVAYEVRVLNSMPLGTIMTNTADADWSTMDGTQPFERIYNDTGMNANDGSVDSDTASFNIVGLSLAKQFAPDPIGLTIAPTISTLTFTITNPNAFTDLSGIAFIDVLPAGVRIAATPNVVNNCGGTVTAAANGTLIQLVGGVLPVVLAPTTCTISVDVFGTAAGMYTNTTRVISATETGPGNTATDTLIVGDDLMALKRFTPAVVDRGQASLLTINIFNATLNPVTGTLALTDVLPAGLDIVTPGVITPVCNGGTLDTQTFPGEIRLTGGTLASGQGCSFSVTVRSLTIGSYPNTAQVTDGVVINNSNTAMLQVVRPAVAGALVMGDPAISKVGSPNSVTQGEQITWTITVSNPGTIPMTPVFVSDPLPNYLDLIGASSSHGTVSINGQIVTVNIGVLNPGETAVITVDTLANANAILPQLCNDVQVTFPTTTGTNTRTASACAYFYPEDLPDTGTQPVANWWGALGGFMLVMGGWWASRKKQMLIPPAS